MRNAISIRDTSAVGSPLVLAACNQETASNTASTPAQTQTARTSLRTGQQNEDCQRGEGCGGR